MVFILWLFFAFLVAYYGDKKGQGFIGLFFLSILLSPLIGLVVSLITGDKTNKKCKQCAELIKKDAVKCRFCGSEQV